MPSLKRLSGQEVVSILQGFGFRIQSQRGSHIKLRRVVDNQHQTLTIPLHRELATGTLHAIFRQACRFVEEAQLKPEFYVD